MPESSRNANKQLDPRTAQFPYDRGTARLEKLRAKINLRGRRNFKGVKALCISRSELDEVASTLESPSLAEFVNQYGRRSEKRGMVWVSAQEVTRWMNLLRSRSKPRIHNGSPANNRGVDRNGIRILPGSMCPGYALQAYRSNR